MLLLLFFSNLLKILLHLPIATLDLLFAVIVSSHELILCETQCQALCKKNMCLCLYVISFKDFIYINRVDCRILLRIFFFRFWLDIFWHRWFLCDSNQVKTADRNNFSINGAKCALEYMQQFIFHSNYRTWKKFKLYFIKKVKKNIVVFVNHVKNDCQFFSLLFYCFFFCFAT